MSRFPKGHISTHCQKGHELTIKNTYIGQPTQCRTCGNERAKLYQRRRYQADPARFAKQRNDYQLVYKYGITPEQHAEMLAKQEYRCANKGCRTDTPGGRNNAWHTDHDHETGKVRAILCNSCNVTLGMAKDDIERLVGLVDYLREHTNGE